MSKPDVKPTVPRPNLLLEEIENERIQALKGIANEVTQWIEKRMGPRPPEWVPLPSPGEATVGEEWVLREVTRGK